jgi:hypothetical protein
MLIGQLLGTPAVRLGCSHQLHDLGVGLLDPGNPVLVENDVFVGSGCGSDHDRTSDHRDQLDDDSRLRAELIEELRSEVGEHPLVTKLRATGQI